MRGYEGSGGKDSEGLNVNFCQVLNSRVYKGLGSRI